MKKKQKAEQEEDSIFEEDDEQEEQGNHRLEMSENTHRNMNGQAKNGQANAKGLSQINEYE